MKHKNMTSILLCLSLTATFSACQASGPDEAQAPSSSETSAATESSAETSPEETTTEESSVESTESVEAVEERNKAYIDYIKKNSDSICIQAIPDEQGSLVPYDFNADGTEDLLINMTGEDCKQIFRLISYKNGEVEVLGDFPYYSEYNEKAKAQDLAVFMLKDSSKIVVFYNNDGVQHSRSFSVYAPDGSGKYVQELNTSTDESDDKQSFKINGEDSDKEALEAEEAKFKGNIGELIFKSYKAGGEFYDPALKGEIDPLESKALNRGEYFKYAGMKTVQTLKGEEIEGFDQGLEFYFSSGAGAWGSQLMLFPDGDFTGYYHDSDMGDQGKKYPNGTVYYCSFSGSFSDFEYVNDHTVKAKLNLKLDEEPGKEKIEEGVRYISSEAYGLEKTDYVLFYLKGAKKADLPEDFTSWTFRSFGEEFPDTLPRIGMFNEKQGEGWIS